MSKLRISQVVVQLHLLDEFDAPVPAEPISFVGSQEGTAVEKAKVWLTDISLEITPPVEVEDA